MRRIVFTARYELDLVYNSVLAFKGYVPLFERVCFLVALPYKHV
jgi:hypothetical protein